jgi:predicted aconitase with swiveling domain
MMIYAEALTSGTAEGSTVRLTEPLSFWGGTDAYGRIVDPRHPQYGTVLAGRVLVMESGRGSSSSSSVLAEQIRAHVAPAAIVLAKTDAIVVLAAIVAGELYGLDVPILLVEPPGHAEIPAGIAVRVEATPSGGAISWYAPGYVE